MEFLSNLHADVKLLLVAGALALLAALVSGTQKNERRYMTLFTLVMLVAGWRFYAHEREDEALAGARAAPVAIQATKGSSAARHKSAN